jgi:hypothetical protein
MTSYSYSYLIFDKGAKIHINEKIAFSPNGAEKTEYSHIED